MSLETIISEFVAAVSPSFKELRDDLRDFKSSNWDLSMDDLAEKYADKICWKYASVGAASALPAVIPGIGTGTQIAIEATSVGAELMLMIRWMASMTYGIGLIYSRDIETNFNKEFVMVLAKWCGVLVPVNNAAGLLAVKIAQAQVNKIPGTLFIKINQRIGATFVTKYGVKRGGIAIGKIIPFGVGSIVAGGFNLATMKAFKKKSIEHFKTKPNAEFTVV